MSTFAREAQNAGVSINVRRMFWVKIMSFDCAAERERIGVLTSELEECHRNVRMNRSYAIDEQNKKEMARRERDDITKERDNLTKEHDKLMQKINDLKTELFVSKSRNDELTKSSNRTTVGAKRFKIDYGDALEDDSYLN